MKTSVVNIGSKLLAGWLALVFVGGCTLTTLHGPREMVVPIAQYGIHMANASLESLHRIQINDIAGLRQHLERSLANDILIAWAAISSEETTNEDRTRAFGMLRLIAVQNEKFPVVEWNARPDLMQILNAATQKDLQHTEWLRRQDWSQPKWIRRVD